MNTLTWRKILKEYNIPYYNALNYCMYCDLRFECNRNPCPALDFLRYIGDNTKVN